jgi:four helix bundle protein
MFVKPAEEINTNYFSIDFLMQKADRLANWVYDLTLTFPQTEQYCLTQQLRRAVLSVPANIAEGYARKRLKSYQYFLEISYASLAETKYFLTFARKRGYVFEKEFAPVYDLADELSRLLWTSIKKLNFKKENNPDEIAP